MIRIAINGAAGRMGREVVLLAHEDEELELVAAIEAAGSPSIGADAGAVAGAGELGIAVTDALAAGADVLIDFSTPDGTAACLDACRKSGTAMVIGTTGRSAEQRDALTAASADIPILI
ncbi:MAG: 4-hydroxy-tetrahydrodipicolinate reductase, partial [Planctomycetia bacterium]|nr:4-hydroxy-tetrahydrodipicolinate reductase [Planctomycetia bacterium]